MKVLIIGLGSMGSRRIRNLMQINTNFELYGYDANPERIKNAVEKYKVLAVKYVSPEIIKNSKIEVIIISTSPESHLHYANLAVDSGCNAFIEASVVDASGIKALGIKARKKNLKIVPSCTMLFNEFVKSLRVELNENKTIGKIISFSYHTGQRLEDWHPWESIKDYYVSKKATGGCREIVPFELTWLAELFGFPIIKYAFKEKSGSINCEIDDQYFFHGKFGENINGFVFVEVLSRPVASRRIQIIGEKGKIEVDGMQNIKISVIGEPLRNVIIESSPTHPGYINPEKPYIDEMTAFFDYIRSENGGVFPNTLSNDSRIIETLDKIDLMANANA